MINSTVRGKAFILTTSMEPRNSSLLDSLKALNIPYEFFMDASPQLAREYLSELVPVKVRNMSDGEVACAYGHLMIYLKILEEKCDWGLILEDDAVLITENFPRVLNEELRRKSILLLGTCGGLSFRKAHKMLGKKFFRMFGNPLVGSHAYIVTRECAKQLYEWNKEILAPADAFLRPKEINLYVQYPYSAWQLSATTTYISRELQSIKTSRTRILAGKIKADFMELKRSGRIGTRIANTTVLRLFLSPLLKKLPGCRDFPS